MLEVRNISYGVRGKAILSNISFSVGPGKLVAILGPNGAGKSTLLKIISRELNALQGTIFFSGKQLHSHSVEQLSLQRAVLTQSIQLSSRFEANEVVMMGRYPHFESFPSEKDKAIVNEVMQMTETYPYNDRIYQELSGGEQQRIQFARVMTQVRGENVFNRMLLLDEPLNNLDVRHQYKLLSIASEFSKNGNTVLTVLHDINLAAMYADEVILMAKGHVHSIGLPKDVITGENITSCYDFPARVESHPFHQCPVVYFGCPEETKTDSFFQQTELITTSNL